MTVHWNSRKGFANGEDHTSTTDTQAMDEEARAYVAELLWQMRKTPDVRASQVARAKKLIADPRYPSEEVLRKVADLLAKGFKQQDRE